MLRRPPASRRPAAVATLCAALLLSAPAAPAASARVLGPQSPMPMGAPAPPPLGYLKFCAVQPRECGLGPDSGELAGAATAAERERRLVADHYWSAVFNSAEASAASRPVAPLRADAALVGELDAVNLRVNRSIRRLSDLAQYGERDVWTLPLAPGGSRAGDCKDFVLEKRHALVEAGLPSEDLAIAVAATPWGETHAVLLVATDRGELALDNLSDRVEPWRRLDYRWIARQTPGDPLTWVSVGKGSTGKR